MLVVGEQVQAQHFVDGFHKAQAVCVACWLKVSCQRQSKGNRGDEEMRLMPAGRVGE
jgi:hypothetical protein